MRLYSFGNRCPLCHLTFRYRISRKFYMRLIPGSRHYLCDYCGYTSFSFFKKISIRLFHLHGKKVRAIIDSCQTNHQNIISETAFISKDDNVILLKN